MPIRIPDKLERDCGDCQALCCYGMDLHKPAFPIEKNNATPCPNLETGTDGMVGQFRCRIHDSLAETGWGACVKFDCAGAGQAVSTFFAEMGFNWMERGGPVRDVNWTERYVPEDEAIYRVRNKNMRIVFGVLYKVFLILKHHEDHNAPIVAQILRARLETELLAVSQAITNNHGIMAEGFQQHLYGVIREVLDQQAAIMIATRRSKKRVRKRLKKPKKP